MTENDLRKMVGDELSEAEVDALREADDLLRAAEPLPEASSELDAAVGAIPASVEQDEERRRTRRRSLLERRPAVLAYAAALAGIAFAIGWFARGGGEDTPAPADVVTLEATRFASNEAEMVIDVFPVDEAGNWVLLADVAGLEQMGNEQYYELWLTRSNRVIASCGRFLVDEAGTASNLWFNAPYDFAEFDDWVVTIEGPGNQRSRVMLRAPVTTPAT